MGNPHFLAIPYPILGHMNPLMQFSHILAKHGCKITFLTSDENYNKMKTTSIIGGKGKIMESHINLVSLPDGVNPQDDRKDVAKVILSTKTTMSAMLPKVIEEINNINCDNKISCIIVTKNMGWALEVAHQLGIKGALFWPASATCLVSFNSMESLVEEGIIDSQNGLPKKEEIQLSTNLPMMEAAAMPWYNLHNAFFFLHMMKEMQNMNLGEWWLCNTSMDLEAEAISLSPKFLPIGPLMGNEHNIMGSLWQEDETCLEWLDQYPPKSIIYVSFGSLISIGPNQFIELAHGLDLLKRPYLWVVRKDKGDNEVKNSHPNELKGNQGKIIDWSPQKKILCHPSIACFITHCGWNSTIESVCNGVPMLCWPFFSDQLMNKTYICDVWKVGLGFEKDENGLITKEEIKKKVDELLEDEEIKERCLKLMEMVVKNKGEGDNNLNKFINWAKE
ncbi:UDP-glycosyltransferase 83A1 [Cicer arietinum]|uniref:Glycosyltransferase n=1 Tax=Cicer arietinum TaxID=3827 RepID=A0A1S2XHM0_CICAR|nr:UDP-glycosyltransferase 83A1-like [Cicer arietinum]